MSARITSRAFLACAAALVAAPASLAGYTITQGASAPQYTDFTLNFDEPGTPTGGVGPDFWAVSHGLTLDSGVGGGGQVADFDPGWGLGDGQSWLGPFGAFMTFDTDLTGMSLEVWDPSGPPTPFGGGLGVFIFNDGVEVGSLFVEPAWGGLGDTWFNIVGDGGDVFDEVRILGFGFPADTYIDNLSWNVVPGPGALALFGVAGLARRRRRA
ncbi:MAG: hypothetical protein KDA25_13255 [Phycisphaerales bacterium]|nr:hypothetical protein [Phycisphaerales bacterium]